MGRTKSSSRLCRRQEYNWHSPEIAGLSAPAMPIGSTHREDIFHGGREAQLLPDSAHHRKKRLQPEAKRARAAACPFCRPAAAATRQNPLPSMHHRLERITFGRRARAAVDPSPYGAQSMTGVSVPQQVISSAAIRYPRNRGRLPQRWTARRSACLSAECNFHETEGSRRFRQDVAHRVDPAGSLSQCRSTDALYFGGKRVRIRDAQEGKTRKFKRTRLRRLGMRDGSPAGSDQQASLVRLRHESAMCRLIRSILRCPS